MSNDDVALLWAIRIDAGTMSPQDEADLDAWLDGDPGRKGSLLRAQAILSYFDRARALGGVARALTRSSPREMSTDQGCRRFPVPRRRLFAYGIAAAITAAFGFELGHVWPQDESLDTVLGEIRSVPLVDGSTATINTQSRLAIDMDDAHRRTVRLHKGEAWFKVAHDPNRPFVVEAGDVRVRAVGTAFAVRRESNDIKILVTEGTVETWVVGQERRSKRLGAGAMAHINPAMPAIRSENAEAEIERSLSWRSGDLAFDGESLGEAANEFNRYNNVKLVVDDPRLMREPVVGYFNAKEPEVFARAFSDLVGANVVLHKDVIRLEPQQR